MGKSRLVREALVGHSGPVFVGRAGSGGVPLRPLVEIALAASRNGADLGHPSVAAFRPVLGALLPVPEGAGPAAGGSPLVLAEGLLRLLATCQPRGVVVVEDLHWADADTLIVVEYIADYTAQAGLLFVVTLRAEEAGPAADLVASMTARRCACRGRTGVAGGRRGAPAGAGARRGAPVAFPARAEQGGSAAGDAGYRTGELGGGRVGRDRGDTSRYP